VTHACRADLCMGRHIQAAVTTLCRPPTATRRHAIDGVHADPFASIRRDLTLVTSSLSLLSHTALTPPCPLSRGGAPRRVSLALRRCAPGSSRARPPPHTAGKTGRASMGSVSVQTAVWRSCVWHHSHALASHIGGTRWSSLAVVLASVCFSWAFRLSVAHRASCSLLWEPLLGVSPPPPYLPM